MAKDLTTPHLDEARRRLDEFHRRAQDELAQRREWALDAEVQCTFCGRMTRNAITAPNGGVFICDQCIDLCHFLFHPEQS